ncbi:MAG: hypothetical protein DRN71_01585 [Candidatus Nanohalarchaeota archaeon]|nr:MAG: hypothetical protein DRN71_01585 [Candidatus Nanohaloarchaeota archaeon]
MDKSDLPQIVLDVGFKRIEFSLMYRACTNPECDRSGVTIRLVNDVRDISFFIDFETGTYEDGDYSEEVREIIESFIVFMNSCENESYNLDFFKRYYKEAKKDGQIREDTISSYKPGMMMFYHGIFVNADIFEVKSGDKVYLLRDQYCVNPGCDCSDIGLDFFEKIPVQSIQDSDFSITYNYADGRFTVAKCADRNRLNAMVGSFGSEMNEMFKERHERIKKEVAPLISDKFKQRRGLINMLKSSVGRNDPCPCGSGKKYKKCCLNKE